MIYIFLGITITLIIFFLYCCLAVSSKCSKEEEKMYERSRRKVR